MIKLYILYIVLGFYMLYYSMLLWVFPLDGGILQTEMALAASVVLFFIAPPVCLYKPQIAPVVGLVCLAGISPLGIHSLQYKLTDEYLVLWKIENILMYVAVIWYLVTLAATINAFAYRKGIKVADVNKKVKLLLALVPLIVFAVFAVYFSVQ